MVGRPPHRRPSAKQPAHVPTFVMRVRGETLLWVPLGLVSRSQRPASTPSYKVGPPTTRRRPSAAAGRSHLYWWGSRMVPTQIAGCGVTPASYKPVSPNDSPHKTRDCNGCGFSVLDRTTTPRLSCGGSPFSLPSWGSILLFEAEGSRSRFDCRSGFPVGLARRASQSLQHHDTSGSRIVQRFARKNSTSSRQEAARER